ncbi:MAG: hypothetical protein ACR2NU_04295 [Aeoliella sp.]
MNSTRIAMVVLCCMTFLVAPAPVAQAERPTAMKLFPYETLAFVRVAHGRELYESFRQTGFGQLVQDPQVQPFLGETWDLAGRQFDENASEEVGFSWDDISRIPKGEIAVALVARGTSDPGVLVLADFDGEQEDADYLMEKFRQRWEAEGMVTEEQPLEGDTLIVVREGDNRDTSFGYLLKETCLIASNDEVLLAHVLDRWAGRSVIVEPPEETTDEEANEDAATAEPMPGERTLAENPSFVSILRDCSTQLEEPPQIVFYADPLGIFKTLAGDDTGARIAIATFPALGLDGILGVGGTMSFATEKWDGLAHFHLLLDNPRSGVLTLLRFESGDVTPPEYVPADVYGYSTAYVDAPGIFDRLNQLVDKFRYEGSLRESIDSGISEPLGFDYEDVLINNFAGRFTLVTSYDKPHKVQGEQRAVVATLLDPEKTKSALGKIEEQFGDRFEQAEFGGVDYYAFVPRAFRDMPEEDRPFTACFCVLDDNLILSSSVNIFEAMIEAHQGTGPRLADSIEYKVIQSRVERLTRGQELALFYYEDAKQAIRHWYEVGESTEARDGLASIGENFAPAQEFLDILEGNELPSFDALEKYMVPTGGYMLDTNTGLHFMAFDLRRAGDE